MRDPLLYGDYRTSLTPEQPRVYEDIQDYDVAKGLFEEVCIIEYLHTYIHVHGVHACAVFASG